MNIIIMFIQVKDRIYAYDKTSDTTLEQIVKLCEDIKNNNKNEVNLELQFTYMYIFEVSQI